MVLNVRNGIIRSQVWIIPVEEKIEERQLVSLIRMRDDRVAKKVYDT